MQTSPRIALWDGVTVVLNVGMAVWQHPLGASVLRGITHLLSKLELMRRAKALIASE